MDTKFLILLIFISVVIMGISCSYVVHFSDLKEIKIISGCPWTIAIEMVIGCLILGVLFVTVAVIK